MFRKKTIRSRVVSRIPREVFVDEVSVVSEEHDGEVTQVVKYDRRNILDPSTERDIPDCDEFSIENQIKAGIQPKQCPTGHLLDPTDPHDLSEASTDALLSQMASAGSVGSEDPREPSSDVDISDVSIETTN